jgi:chromosome segregation ATPase
MALENLKALNQRIDGLEKSIENLELQNEVLLTLLTKYDENLVKEFYHLFHRAHSSEQ